MVNGIKTIYTYEVNKRFNSKICVGSQVRCNTPEEGRRTSWLKSCMYNEENENSLNILSDKNYQDSSQKFM